MSAIGFVALSRFVLGAIPRRATPSPLIQLIAATTGVALLIVNSLAFGGTRQLTISSPRINSLLLLPCLSLQTMERTTFSPTKLITGSRP